MLDKLKKNLINKLLVAIWLIFTTGYFIFGMYDHFQNQVYQAGIRDGENEAFNAVIIESEKGCSGFNISNNPEKPVVLINTACLKQSAPVENTSTPSEPVSQ